MTKVIGTREATVQLIQELYIDLRNKVNEWSQITKQTPQARMGYVGQHLVSVVTGFPGGRSGARGHDIELPDGKYGEIKTCYKVDQLGHCKDCNSTVSSIEIECPACGSKNIERKNDSKWLITIRNDTEFEEVLNPLVYYFVLFDYDDIANPDDNKIIASIWEVNPKNKGFAYCMMDYYLNIRSASESKAPFNMWPYSLKFALTKPRLIFRCEILDNNVIITKFPDQEHGVFSLDPLYEYSSARTVTGECVIDLISNMEPDYPIPNKPKKKLLEIAENIRVEKHIPDDDLIDVLIDGIYLPLLEKKKDQIPLKYREMYPDLK